MAYITPNSGTIYRTTSNIGLSTKLVNTPFLGNIYMFPFEKMKITGNQVSLFDFNNNLFKVFDVNFRHTITTIREYYKSYPDNYVAYYFMSIYNKQYEHLELAIKHLEKTGKNRFKDEIRQLSARMNSGNLEAKVSNYPGTSIFDSKTNTNSVKSARHEIDLYNETTYHYGVFSSIISERGINPKSFENSPPTLENVSQQIDYEALNTLIENLEKQSNSKKVATYVASVFITILVLRQIAKNKK